MVNRVYVKKRNGYRVEANEILHNLRTQLSLDTINDLEVVNRYDVEGVNDRVLADGIKIILSEPMVDDVILEDFNPSDASVFAIEYLPGQYDQRADACEQCFQILANEKNVKDKCAKLVLLYGD